MVLLEGFGELVDDILAERQEKEAQDERSKIYTSGLVVHEDASPGCGGLIWESAGAIISYLEHFITTTEFDAHKYSGNIVELGAGTGIVGLSYYRLLNEKLGVKCEKLYLTDLQCILPITRNNVELNGFGNDVNNGNICICPLEWANNDHISQLLSSEVDGEQNHYPNLVLISDCVYFDSCFNALLKTLESNIGPETLCIMSYKKRRHAEKRFFTMLQKVFRVCNMVRIVRVYLIKCFIVEFSLAVF